jgi:hypothetical protein
MGCCRGRTSTGWCLVFVHSWRRGSRPKCRERCSGPSQIECSELRSLKTKEPRATGKIEIERCPTSVAEQVVDRRTVDRTPRVAT